MLLGKCGTNKYVYLVGYNMKLFFNMEGVYE